MIKKSEQTEKSSDFSKKNVFLQKIDALIKETHGFIKEEGLLFFILTVAAVVVPLGIVGVGTLFSLILLSIV